MSEERHFFNPHLRDPSCQPDASGEKGKAGQVPPALAARLREDLELRLARCDSVYRSSPSADSSVYTGTAGVALLHLHAATTVFADDEAKRSSHLRQALSLLTPSLHHLHSRDKTFLCGAAGPLAIAAVTEAALGKGREAKALASQLEELYTQDKKSFSRLPSEMLYGHTGYLYAVLFVNSYIPGAIGDEVVEEVARLVLQTGQQGKEKDIPSPLMFSWHGKHYLGAAHGLAGIGALLLQVPIPSLGPLLSSLLQPTINYLLSLQMPSGNFPASLESYHSDRLVHWCHGAPGFVHLMAHAYEVFKDERYLDSAQQCGDVVWERGLLKKGYGICHGTAGNAYTFLQLYRLTGQAHHWNRALKFAEWCLTSAERMTREPDRPFSMFEGAAGVAYFYCDLLTSSGHAPFPALELPKPKQTYTHPQ